MGGIVDLHSKLQHAQRAIEALRSQLHEEQWLVEHLHTQLEAKVHHYLTTALQLSCGSRHDMGILPLWHEWLA